MLCYVAELLFTSTTVSPHFTLNSILCHSILLYNVQLGPYIWKKGGQCIKMCCNSNTVHSIWMYRLLN